MRPRRSCLSVPATRPELHPKAAASAADEVFFDLEDSVPAHLKAQGREAAAAAARDLDLGRRIVGVRVNACSTPWCHQDVAEVVLGAGDRLDVLVVPKVESAAEVHFLDVLLAQLEARAGRRRRVGLELQIETARGMEKVGEIAAASDRTEALIFGPGDYSASMGFGGLSVGGLRPDYPGDFWQPHLVRLAIAARAHGLAAIDGPHGAIRDLEGLRESSRRSALLGFDGRWVLSPAQVGTVNEMFTPAPEEVERARALIAAHAEAATGGSGAFMHGAEMVDEASRRMAESILARAGIEPPSG